MASPALAEALSATDDEQAWEDDLRALARDLNQRQWEIADAITEATTRWGDKYTVAVKITGKKEKTLKNWVSVAGKFEKSRRRDS